MSNYQNKFQIVSMYKNSNKEIHVGLLLFVVDSTEANLNEEVVDLYEAYLRGKPFPRKYYNEHKKFIAAKDRMKKNQQQKTAKVRL